MGGGVSGLNLHVSQTIYFSKNMRNHMQIVHMKEPS